MNLRYLIVASFFAGLGLGYTKFFAFSFLGAEAGSLQAKTWIIQVVGALITVGPFLIYFLSGPLAAGYRKRRVLFLSGAATAGVMLLGLASGWVGTAWSYVFMAGVLMGVYNSARNATVPIEAAHSTRSTEMINAWLNIAYLAGMLIGVPGGVEMFQRSPFWGAMLGVAVFASAALFGGLCFYPREDGHLEPFHEARRRIMGDSWDLLKKYWLYLTPVALIWGLASATSLAATAFAEESRLGTATQCSLLSLFAAVSVGAGNALAEKLKFDRYRAAAGAAAGMAVMVLAIPTVVLVLHPSKSLGQNTVPYIGMVIVVLGLGLMFGLASNLLEAEYFNLVYKERKEGTGAALLSASISFFSFLFGGVVGLAIIYGWFGSVSQFIWLAAAAALTALLVVRLGMVHGWKAGEPSES